MAVFPRRKVNHDFLVAGGLEVTGNTTLTGTLTQTGVATFAAAPVFTAGIGSLGAVSAQKGAITMSTGGYVADKVEAWTGANCERVGSTGLYKMIGYGVTKVSLTKAHATGAANFQLVMGNPVKAGVSKYVVLYRATGASTFEIWLCNESSAQTFYGTTADAIKLTTDWVSPNPAGFHFIGITTDQWAALSVNGLQSTQWSYATSTFSAT